MPNELSARIALGKLWEGLEKYAKAKLDATGLLDPVGMIEEVDQRRSLVVPIQAIEQIKGLPPNTLVRMVQDMIVAIERPPARVAILYGADLTPVDGGDSDTALVSWLEESPGFAVRVVTRCEIREEGVVLGQRQVTPEKPVLLTKEDRADVGRGRIGSLDIRPRINFRIDSDLTIDEAADLLLLLALDRETEETDWGAVAHVGLDRQRFHFERVCLRTTAVVISLVHLDAEALRHDVEARFWDRMHGINRHVNTQSQTYFEAFRASESAKDSRVFSEFSHRCSGAQHRELIAFAHKTFGTLMVVCQQWLKRHGVKP